MWMFVFWVLFVIFFGIVIDVIWYCSWGEDCVIYFLIWILGLIDYVYSNVVEICIECFVWEFDDRLMIRLNYEFIFEGG